MISKLSVFFSEGIGLRLNSSDNEKMVYAYSIEVLLSLLINLLILSTFSYIFDKKLQLLIFIIFFSSLRMYAGGYHAKTHIGCFAASLSAFVMTIMSGTYLTRYGEIILILGGMFSILMVFRFAPVDTENKPLSKNERKKYRTISRAIVLILSLAAALLYLTRAKTGYLYINAILAMVIESVSLLKK